jgi:hypothetical protein
MSLLSQGLDWHGRQLARSCGTAAQYVRGSLRIALPDAIEGRTEYETEGDEGQLIKSTQIDFLVNPQQLKRNSVRFDPEVGDQIIAGGRTYEVQLYGDDPCFRPVSESLVRIHVRLVKDA